MVCNVLSLKRVKHSRVCPTNPDRLFSGVIIGTSPYFCIRKDWFIFLTRSGYPEMEAVERLMYHHDTFEGISSLERSGLAVDGSDVLPRVYHAVESKQRWKFKAFRDPFHPHKVR